MPLVNINLTFMHYFEAYALVRDLTVETFRVNSAIISMSSNFKKAPKKQNNTTNDKIVHTVFEKGLINKIKQCSQFLQNLTCHYLLLILLKLLESYM